VTNASLRCFFANSWILSFKRMVFFGASWRIGFKKLRAIFFFSALLGFLSASEPLYVLDVESLLLFFATIAYPSVTLTRQGDFLRYSLGGCFFCYDLFPDTSPRSSFCRSLWG